MVSLSTLYSRLSKHKDLFDILTHDLLGRFLDIVTRYMPRILTTAPRVRKALPDLPNDIRDVLALSLGFSYDQIDDLWSATGDLLVIEFEKREAGPIDSTLDVDLARAAPHFGLGVEVMIAPQRVCLNHSCQQYGQRLGGDRKQFSGTLFTYTRGVLPVQIVTLYCRACKTTYRPNYSVSSATSPSAVRQYYKGVPKYLEVTQHFYVDEDLVMLFRHQMAFSHASADGCAKIYNLSMRNLPEHTSKMSSEIVWNAFYIYALLLQHNTDETQLRLAHHGEQADRISAALQERNERMVGIGQREWAHACDDCEKIVKVDDPAGGVPRYSRLSACVMDSVCIGHPRCQVYHCTARLESPRDQFCRAHRDLDTICAIGGCDLPCTDGKRTCATASHRQVEEDRRRKGRAMFELKRRLQARDLASNIRAVSAEESPGSMELDDPDLDEPAQTSNVERKKSGSRKPKIKSTLTRRWTHNEQLLVRPCGVVLSRATFYEAESLPNCRLFLNATFPKHFPRSLPSFMFFDNNCKLLSHLVNVDDDHLLTMGFPVDVFHAVNKHQESDGYCQDHCNPAGFPELIGEDDEEWVFNSSACEQVNVWYAKFLPVVREMSEIHFNFFLDEMVGIRNGVRVAKLSTAGRRPRLIPVQELMAQHIDSHIHLQATL